MTSSSTAILTNPNPCEHIVFAYTNDSQIADAVAVFAWAGLAKGETVVLVMTDAHRTAVRVRMERHTALDLNTLQSSKQLVWHDAWKLLSTFFLDGVLEEHKFTAVIGEMIRAAKAGNRPVRVFGEMVNLMWNDHPHATERLEQLWNEVIAEHGVPLLCAYSLAGPELPASLSDLHSSTIA